MGTVVSVASVGTVVSVASMRLWLGLVGVRVGDVRGMLGLVLHVVSIGVICCLLVRHDNSCRSFSKDAAAPERLRIRTSHRSLNYDCVTHNAFKWHSEARL